MAISGNFGYVLLQDDSISKIDLTASIANAVTDNWASIQGGVNDSVSAEDIIVVGSNFYVTSTITGINQTRTVWTSNIPLSAPGTITTNWAEIGQSNDTFVSAGSLATDGTSIFATYAEYSTDVAPCPSINGVRSFNLANPVTTTDWNYTTALVQPANSLAVANGWVYVANSRVNPYSSNQIMCAQVSPPMTFSTCSSLTGEVIRAIHFDNAGTTAYVSMDSFGDYTLQPYAVNGSSLDPSAFTPAPLQYFAQNFLIDGTTAYLGNYETVDVLTLGLAQQLSTPPWASLVADSDSVQILKYSNYIYSVNSSTNDDGDNTVSSIYNSSPAPAASISPASQTLTGTEGTAFTSGSLTPSNFTSTVSYSISPGLPAGLSFNTSTGVISATPTVSFASTVFTITATGTETATGSMTLTIAAASNQGLQWLLSWRK